MVSGSADFCAAGNRSGLWGRSFASAKSRQTGHPGRKELLDPGPFHHANGDDHRRGICRRLDAHRVSRHPSLSRNSQDAAGSGCTGGVVLHADLADLLGLEPDFQRTLCPGTDATRQGNGLPRGRRRRVSRAGSGLGDGAIFVGCHADGDQVRHAAHTVQHQWPDPPHPNSSCGKASRRPSS